MRYVGIGDNRPPFETVEDLPPDLPKMHYFKCDLQALRKALFDKPLELRGAFMSVLLALYEFMEPLSADDNIARMRCGIMDIRVYRRVKRELLSLGLAHLTLSGRLSNRRFEEEIAAYVTDFVKRQKAAKEAQVASANRVTKGAANGVDKPNFPRTSDEPRGVPKPELTIQLRHDLSEKTNEINEANIANDVLRARVLKLELELEERKKGPPSPQTGGAPSLEKSKAEIPKGPTPTEALHAFEAYNATALRLGLQQAAKLTPDRQRKIIARLRDYGVDGWARALANLEQAPFLRGKNERGWRADLDFLLQASSFGKLHDGGYGGTVPAVIRPNKAPQTGPEVGSDAWLRAVDAEFSEMDKKTELSNGRFK